MSNYVNAIYPQAINSAYKPYITEALSVWNRIIGRGPGGFYFQSGFQAGNWCQGVNYYYQAGSSINGIDMFVYVYNIDGNGGLYAMAGPCAIRLDNNAPIMGTVQIDVSDASAVINQGGFVELIVHEIGHVLGIGTYWETYNLLLRPCAYNNAPCNTNPIYRGSFGVGGFEDLGGSGGIPVENSGGSATRNKHWRESYFGIELMTGYLNGGVKNPLSIMSIKSVADLGYYVDITYAESYFIPSQYERPMYTTDIELFGDIIEYDLILVDESMIEELPVNKLENQKLNQKTKLNKQLDSLFLSLLVMFIASFIFIAYLSNKNKMQLNKLK